MIPLSLGLGLGALGVVGGNAGAAAISRASSDYDPSTHDGLTTIPNSAGAGSATLEGTAAISGGVITLDGGGSVLLQAGDAPSGDFTFAVACSLTTPRSNFDTIWSAESASNRGLLVRDNGNAEQVEFRYGGTGGLNTTPGALIDANAGSITLICSLDITGSVMTSYLNGVSLGTSDPSTVGTVVQGTPRVGARGYDASLVKMEGTVSRIIHWNEALDATDVAAVHALIAA